jgi:hypothetical protein
LKYEAKRRILCKNISFLGEKMITIQLNITNEKFRAPLADAESLDFLNVAERVENAVSSLLYRRSRFKLYCLHWRALSVLNCSSWRFSNVHPVLVQRYQMRYLI